MQNLGADRVYYVEFENSQCNGLIQYIPILQEHFRAVSEKLAAHQGIQMYLCIFPRYLRCPIEAQRQTIFAHLPRPRTSF